MLNLGRYFLLALFLCVPVVGEAAPCPVTQTAGEKIVKLTWTNVDTDVTHSVNILRSTQPGVESVIANVPYATAYQETVPAYTVDTTYFYTVQAVGGGGNKSGVSNEVCKTFFTIPAAPTLLQVQ